MKKLPLKRNQNQIERAEKERIDKGSGEAKEKKEAISESYLRTFQ